MKLLVTGMTGFIAGRFFQYMAREHPEVDTYGFDRAYKQDLCDSDAVEKAIAGMDAVIHFGALTHIDSSIADPRPFLETNITGAFNVLQAVTKAKAKLILISSSEVYGSLTQAEYDAEVVQDELYPLRPHSPYAATKVAQDRLAYSWWQTYETNVRIVRPFNQWGPGQDIRKMIPKFFKQASEGSPITIYGDGQSTRDWVYVDDTCDALWRSLDLPAGEVVNVATGTSYTVMEMAEKVKRVVGRHDAKVTLVSHTDQRWGHVKHLKGSASRLTRLTGWKPTVDVDEGLTKLYQWLLTNGHVCYHGGEGPGKVRYTVNETGRPATAGAVRTDA